MSDNLLNIRFLFWHFKLQQKTFKVSLNFNIYHWSRPNRLDAILKPIEIHEWNLK